MLGPWPLVWTRGVQQDRYGQGDRDEHSSDGWALHRISFEGHGLRRRAPIVGPAVATSLANAPCPLSTIRAVSRRSSPDRIYRARRAAVLSRLTQVHRLSAERAEALVAAWEAEGDSRGLERMTAAFRDAGTTWIDEQLGEKT